MTARHEKHDAILVTGTQDRRTQLLCDSRLAFILGRIIGGKFQNTTFSLYSRLDALRTNMFQAMMMMGLLRYFD